MKSGCSTHIRRIFTDYLPSNLKYALQDLKIIVHHTLQDIIKIIMLEGVPHVISRSRSSLMFQLCLHMLANVLAAICIHPVHAKLSRFHLSAFLSPHVCDILYRQLCYYKTSRSSFLHLHYPTEPYSSGHALAICESTDVII